MTWTGSLTYGDVGRARVVCSIGEILIYLCSNGEIENEIVCEICIGERGTGLCILEEEICIDAVLVKGIWSIRYICFVSKVMEVLSRGLVTLSWVCFLEILSAGLWSLYF